MHGYKWPIDWPRTRTDQNGVVCYEEFEAWWEGGGKLSASEKLDAKFAAFSSRFDDVMHKALGVATKR